MRLVSVLSSSSRISIFTKIMNYSFKIHVLLVDFLWIWDYFYSRYVKNYDKRLCSIRKSHYFSQPVPNLDTRRITKTFWQVQCENSQSVACVKVKRSSPHLSWHPVTYLSFIRSGFSVSPSMTRSRPSSITTRLQRIPPSSNIQTLLPLGP